MLSALGVGLSALALGSRSRLSAPGQRLRPRAQSPESLASSGAEAPTGLVPDFRYFSPGHPRGRQDDTLGETVAFLHINDRIGDVQRLNHDFIGRAAIVGINDPDAVGDHQSTLERRAASGENRQEMTGRHFDDEAGPDQDDLSRRHGHVVCRRQIEPGRFTGAVRRECNG